MVSNGYSARRVFLRRPKVCKTSPNPGRCHPPPPPPPPWPPEEFVIRWECTYTGMTGVESFDVEITVTQTADPDVWAGTLVVGPYTYSATWSVTTLPPTGELDLGRTGGFLPIDALKNAEPIVSPPPSDYWITTWDSKSPWITYCSATFTY